MQRQRTPPTCDSPQEPGACLPPEARAPIRRLRAARLFALLSALSLLCGCASDQTGKWDGPQLLSASAVDTWTFRGAAARRIRTPHYLIYTTVKEPAILSQLPQLMEGGLTQYRQMAPDVQLSDRPMDCYIFNSRAEWDTFTRENTGKDARIYLQIRKGGYTVGDRYVAYYIGPNATASVAAHEGWHQFVSRHFKSRLPPFLEEGMACMFEGVTWRGDLPRWNLSVNQIRVMELRKTIDTRRLWPLEKLVTMHAGEVVDQPGERIEAFYAQSWAFAKFLWEAEGGRYRPAMRRWLADTASGEVFDPSHSHSHLTGPWNPHAVRPMMEHYLGMSFADIEKTYQAYIYKLAFTLYDQQWGS
jgi:hypothetical protein